MKFYNVFKPHLVQFKNGKYAIRRFFILGGWEYRDSVYKDNLWWSVQMVNLISFDSRLAVEQLLLKITAPEPEKDFGTKV
jgi:hypothetical protein